MILDYIRDDRLCVFILNFLLSTIPDKSTVSMEFRDNLSQSHVFLSILFNPVPLILRCPVKR